MLRREESLTALPQKERLSRRRCGHPSARTSVAVSERAQQKDYVRSLCISPRPFHGFFGLIFFFFGGRGGERDDMLLLTRSRSRRPLAALVR